MPKTNILARTFGLKAPAPDAIQRKIDKGERRVEEAEEALRGASYANLDNEGSGDVAAAIRNLTAAKEHVATLRAALVVAERLADKEAAAKAAEARTARNSATLKAFDDLIAKAEAIGALVPEYLTKYQALVEASNAVVVAATNNPEVRRDLIFAVGNVFTATSDEITRLSPENGPHAPGVNVPKHSAGHVDRIPHITAVFTDLRNVIAEGFR